MHPDKMPLTACQYENHDINLFIIGNDKISPAVLLPHEARQM